MELKPWRRASERSDPTRSFAPETPASTPEPRKVCGVCGATYDGASWTALDSVGRMAARDIAPLVVTWKRTRDIDLRKCARCGTVLARLAEFAEDDDV